jgi:hypothetical protein
MYGSLSADEDIVRNNPCAFQSVVLLYSGAMDHTQLPGLLTATPEVKQVVYAWGFS